MWLFFLKYLPWLARLTPVFGFLKGNAKLIAGAALVALVLGTGWYIDSLKDDLADSENLRRTLAGYLDECQDANVDNQITIDALQAAVLNLRDAIVVTDEEARQAAAEAARREAEAAERLSNTLTELEELRNAEPSCAAIADLDVGAACPAAVERLRERARAAAGSQN